jgi:hypothetical protein
VRPAKAQWTEWMLVSGTFGNDAPLVYGTTFGQIHSRLCLYDENVEYLRLGDEGIQHLARSHCSPTETRAQWQVKDAACFRGAVRVDQDETEF